MAYIPQCLQVQGLLGLIGWCRIFVKDYALITALLTQLIKKDEAFIWTDLRDQAFNKLKQILASEPILKLPNFDKAFEVIIDASGQGIGGIL